MIFDSAGNLVWFHPMPAGEDAADFRTQVFHGKNDLTWWQGRTIILGYGLGEDVIADANYRTVAVVRAGNGLPADEHEFTVLPERRRLVHRLQPRPGTTSPRPAGPPAAPRSTASCRRSTSTRAWSCGSGTASATSPLSESYSKPPARRHRLLRLLPHQLRPRQLTGQPADLRAQHLGASTSIDGRTGRDHLAAGRQAQHLRARRGRAVRLPAQRAAAAQRRDQPVRRRGRPAGQPALARRDRQARHEAPRPPRSSASSCARSAPVPTNSQGNLQSLPGGGWMVGWGGLPNFTEFNAQGQVVYDAQLPARREQLPRLPPAVGRAAHRPPRHRARSSRRREHRLRQLERRHHGRPPGSCSTGPSASQLTAVSTTPRSGFETTIPAPAAAFYEVRALSASGRVLGTSQGDRAPSG